MSLADDFQYAIYIWKKGTGKSAQAGSFSSQDSFERENGCVLHLLQHK